MSTNVMNSVKQPASFKDVQSQSIDDMLMTEIEFIDSSEFHKKNAERLIPELPIENNIIDFVENLEAVGEMPAHLANMCDSPLLKPEEEIQLFRRMNYLRFKANALRSKLKNGKSARRQLLNIRELIARSLLIRNRIVEANMRLAISIVKKYVQPHLSFDEMLSDGILLLIQCVDKFNYEHGFRFSTYAYRSISRGAYKRVKDTQREMSRYANAFLEEAGKDLRDPKLSTSYEERTWLAIRSKLADMLSQLDDREEQVIRGRYALGEEMKVRTFQKLADDLGVSKERVRQLEKRAVSKLRTFAITEDLDETIAAY